jgi:hypothetical protein
MAVVVCAALCTAVAFWMASHFRGVAPAMEWLRAVRPALAALQVLAMGLLWIYWDGAVAAVGRRSGMSDETVAQLQRSRLRLYWPLALCVGLNVVRSLTT